MTDVDYLIVGAGAMGMAFADTILTESNASVALVDRRARPGGHWNDAYPHVRLHQPSAFYGVNSRVLGTEAVDGHGWNAGLSELASGTEVVAYFDQVLRQQFLPSGRARFFPMTEHVGDGILRSTVTGDETHITARTIVDAGYMNVTVPSTRPPGYEVDPAATCVPPNELARAGVVTGGDVVIVGGGKTAMDACLFLLEHGLDPDHITWIRPRDQWCLNRAHIQPGTGFLPTVLDGQARQQRAIVESTSIDDLFLRLEAAEVLLRFDPDVAPTMYRCATVTRREIEAMRRVDDVVRLGHVRRIGSDEIVLDEGTIPTSPQTLHVDCTADGLERRPVVPVFGENTITLQTVRFCQQVFSAAFIAHVEVAYDDQAHKNELARVIPHPDTHLDWIRTTLEHGRNTARWQEDADLFAWLQEARLDGFTRDPTPQQQAVVAEHAALLESVMTDAPAAAARLAHYWSRIDPDGRPVTETDDDQAQ